jgi:bifunctional DNA-binding transcriptional regulator/antitoxin component of YhaV-PrlF toxin-antitoxin module
MRITEKGQVTIPIELQHRLGLLPHTEVYFEIHGEGALIRRLESANNERSRLLLGRLRGAATTKLTTDEILALTRSDE